MKVEITIEQFDNGISLKWKDAENDGDTKAIVALDREQSKAIGDIIWNDVLCVMDNDETNKVNLTIEYMDL